MEHHSTSLRYEQIATDDSLIDQEVISFCLQKTGLSLDINKQAEQTKNCKSEIIFNYKVSNMD